MYELILVRHGQSEWNKLNLFTGWVDVDLSEQGVVEARQTGELLKKNQLNIRFAYTSVLKRAIKTCQIALEVCDRLWVPTYKCWQLNERHYGDLQGKNKQQTMDQYGEEQVKIWRRSYSTLPPEANENDQGRIDEVNHYKNNIGVAAPKCESLQSTVERMIPFYESTLKPSLKQYKTILVAAHGNSLRALIKHLKNISDDDIMEFEIPTGSPMLMRLDEKFNMVSLDYLK
jgi:2,3-bisphosphoglycerate-dependent phosphoglycerate mutase